MLQRASHAVFACFRRFEGVADRATAHVGPFFVLLCTVLLAISIVTYFEVYFPQLFWTDQTSTLTALFGLGWSTFLIVNFSYHYYAAVTTLPGSPHDPPGLIRRRSIWMRTQKPPSRASEPVGSSPVMRDRLLSSHSPRTCKKCAPASKDPFAAETVYRSKPERAHHCSVCRTCWLKYDHHCPWINGCVGLHNERSFLLFMAYLSAACGSVAILGLPTLLSTLDFGRTWPHWTPRAFSMLLWILCVAMAFALGVMALWQFWLVGKGETTVEAHDNEYYRKLAKRKKRTYLNPYDLGARRNIAEFFNAKGSAYGWWSVLLPVGVPSSSDGWQWRKRADWQSSMIDLSEELTDDEDGY